MVNEQDVLSNHGLILSKNVLRHLGRAGIFVQCHVSLEYQHLARRYVVRGVESGGAVKDLGRYVTFCGLNGERLEYLHPIDAVGVNGLHAIVIAPAVVRIELFRAGRTCQLLITKHQPGRSEEGRRPRFTNSMVFRGVNGLLQREEVPRFWSRAGEDRGIPPLFAAAVQAVTRGATCVGCSHAHFLMAPASCD